MGNSQKKKLVLIGAGHSHLVLLRHIAREKTWSYNTLLVSEDSKAFYSGMIPGLMAGKYNESEVNIDIEILCKKLGITFVEKKVKRVSQQTIFLADDTSLKFDVCSINVGSEPLQIETTNPHRLVYLKPFSQFIDRWREIQRICSNCQRLSFGVIGGGAASVEIATALKMRLQSNGATSSNVTLITASNRLVPNNTPGISQKIEADLLGLQIDIVKSKKVTRYNEGFFETETGNIERKFDYVFVCTNALPPSWFRETDLPLNSDGFISTDSRLQVREGIFAAGDCASIEGLNISKSGVHAVRQGTVLFNNLKTLNQGHANLVPYVPKSKQLYILISGFNRGRVIWGRHSFEGKLGWKIKSWIDRRYLNSFKSL